MKIALACCGVGRVLRGFEAFTESLYDALGQYAPHLDCTLFQGAGPRNAQRITVPSFGRNDFPARMFDARKAYMLEARSFGLALYPLLRLGRYDIVHYNDLIAGSVLFHLRRGFGGKFKLLYCNGGPGPPVHYHHRCDFAQLLTEPTYREAGEFGLPSTRLFLIPYGSDANRFAPDVHAYRTKIRKELEIPESAKVVLTVACLDRITKRIDYLIREVSSLDRSVWLLAAGQRSSETDSLEKEAQHLLGGRCRFVSWPRERVHHLYGAADVFALPSLREGFGLVTVEAMLCGLPIVIHNGPVFRWIAGGTSARTIDMSLGGELGRALQEILSRNGQESCREESQRRFSWEALVPRYVEMYEKVMAGNPLGRSAPARQPGQ